jgi:hypothetical protein
LLLEKRCKESIHRRYHSLSTLLVKDEWSPSEMAVCVSIESASLKGFFDPLCELLKDSPTELGPEGVREQRPSLSVEDREFGRTVEMLGGAASAPAGGFPNEPEPPMFGEFFEVSIHSTQRAAAE